MIAGWVSPFSSVNPQESAFEYFVPSLKMCPTSMPRAIESGLPQRTHGSPARAWAKTAHSWTFASRRRTKPATCQSRRPAPVTALTASRMDSSAMIRTFSPGSLCGPTKPTGAPVWLSTLSSEASARRSTPSAFFRAISLTSRSPRRSATTKPWSLSYTRHLIMRAAVMPRNVTTSSMPPLPGVGTSTSGASVSSFQGAGRVPVSAFSRFAP